MDVHLCDGKYNKVFYVLQKTGVKIIESYELGVMSYELGVSPGAGVRVVRNAPKLTH